MSLFVYSTKKLNLSMVHRDGYKNMERAREVMHYIQYIVENSSMLSENDISVVDAIKKVPYE